MGNQKKVSSVVEHQQTQRIKLTRQGGVVMAAAAVACLLPIILGMRLYDQLPAIVPTQLIGKNGQDDSIPRAMVVFGIPVLLCLLNLLAHYQLNTDPKRVYGPGLIRSICGWGFPVLSVAAASIFMLQSAGLTVDMQFYTPVAIGLLILMAGGRFLKCSPDSLFAFRFGRSNANADKLLQTNQLAGKLWMALGIVLLAVTMLGQLSFWFTGGAVLLAFAIPILYSQQIG